MHFDNNIFSNLAVIYSFKQCIVFFFLPECNEGCQVTFICGVWERIAVQVFLIKWSDACFGSINCILAHLVVSFINMCLLKIKSRSLFSLSLLLLKSEFFSKLSSFFFFLSSNLSLKCFLLKSLLLSKSYRV